MTCQHEMELKNTIFIYKTHKTVCDACIQGRF